MVAWLVNLVRRRAAARSTALFLAIALARRSVPVLRVRRGHGGGHHAVERVGARRPAGDHQRLWLRDRRQRLQLGYDIWFGTDLQHGYAINPTSYQVLSDSQILVTVPANVGGPVDVRVHNACGTSPVSGGDRFAYQYPSSQCQSGTCSLDIGSSSAGALGHVALGFLDGFNTDGGVTITPGEAQLVDALHPKQWRLGQTWLTAPGGGEFGLAQQAGAQVSLDLTSDWSDWAYNNDRAYYRRPLATWRRLYGFIRYDVKQHLAAGKVSTYFDLWNEPAATGDR